MDKKGSLTETQMRQVAGNGMHVASVGLALLHSIFGVAEATPIQRQARRVAKRPAAAMDEKDMKKGKGMKVKKTTSTKFMKAMQKGKGVTKKSVRKGMKALKKK
jgi:hypothetical protein